MNTTHRELAADVRGSVLARGANGDTDRQWPPRHPTYLAVSRFALARSATGRECRAIALVKLLPAATVRFRCTKQP